jgi:NAD(P)-dependent dehydrogenase (short-subunit alcohol dehydrogenase family)
MPKNINMDFLKNFDLSGKAALITGAIGLLGVEHAEALLEIGCKVILTDINAEKLVAKKELLERKYDKALIMTFIMDVTDKKSIELVRDQLTNSNIYIDILINNAAVNPNFENKKNIFSRLENFPEDQWDFQIEVGLKGAFLCSQIFGSLMSKSDKKGVILNIASDLSVFSPDQRIYKKKGISDANQAVKPITYSIVKTGLIGLTRYISTYWAEYGVRCNALSPGGVFNDQDSEFVKNLTNLIPMGRMAKKDEYKGAIQFLCSDASSYMNGQNIVMDGGRSIW